MIGKQLLNGIERELSSQPAKSADGLWTTAHDGWLITEQSERGGENRKHETATGVETTAEEVIDE